MQLHNLPPSFYQNSMYYEVYKETIEKYMANCKDFDNIILKSHLLIEHKLNECINLLSYTKVEVSKLDLSFLIKTELLKMLGVDQHYIQSNLKLLNRLRNSIAHSLTYNERILQNFISNLSDDDKRNFYGLNGKMIVCIIKLYVLLTTLTNIAVLRRKHPKMSDNSIYKLIRNTKVQ